MLQGITFDFDGTLAKTFERQYNWLKHWAKLNDKTFPFEGFDSFKDFYNKHCTPEKGVQNVYDELGLPCDMNDRNHPVWDAYETYLKEHPVELYQGTKETVQKIWEIGHLNENPSRNKRLRMSINTTSSWDTVSYDLKRAGILPYFDCFVTEEVLRTYHGSNNSSAIHKPSKISLALTLGLIDSEGEFVMHVGDTLNDLAASQKVVRLNPMRPETLITVGAGWGYEGREKLEQGVKVDGLGTVHFNHIVDRPERLVGLVAGMVGERGFMGGKNNGKFN